MPIATPPPAKPLPVHDQWVVLVYNGDLLIGVHGVFKTQEEAASLGRELTPRSEQHAIAYPMNFVIGATALPPLATHDPGNSDAESF